MKNFSALALHPTLLKALKAEKFEIPTPVQAAAIPQLLEGKDLIGIAQTGTGKTAAFALPVLQAIVQAKENSNAQKKKNPISALVLTPTRELAVQVSTSFQSFAKFSNTKSAVVFGGVGYGPQIKSLQRGPDILVATPGRLMDMVAEGHANLSKVKFLICDEADRMLDMGFKKDIEKIISKLPKQRQNILFSATMPSEIKKFANTILVNPELINLSPKNVTAQNVDDEVMFLSKADKNTLLLDLLSQPEVTRTIVFTRTKYIAERLAKNLKKLKFKADSIHGNKSQNARQRTLADFRNGKITILVATDLAARGIDVDEISHVINYQLSDDTENYVHRVGRTARAGRCGKAITLCDTEELGLFQDIQKLLKRKIRINDSHPYHDQATAERSLVPTKSKPKRGGQGRGGQGRSNRNHQNTNTNKKSRSRRPSKRSRKPAQ